MRSEVTWMGRKIPAALNDRPGEGGQVWLRRASL